MVVIKELVVNGKTKVLGIIADPVEHSKSPLLHNYISVFKDMNTIYVPFRVSKEKLSMAIDGIRALNIVGVNVSIPHKNSIMKYIDEVSQEAKLMKAVNTVRNVDGRLYGFNTDGYGFKKSFEEESEVSLKGSRVVVLGAGGAAGAIAVKVALEGAEKITILNRTKEKAQELSEYIAKEVGAYTEYGVMEYAPIKRAISESSIIINTTSIGMYPEVDNSPIDCEDILSKEQVVYDIVYNPVKTKLLLKAEEKGCKAINGLGMLFYQGVQAYEIIMDIKFSDSDIKNLYNKFKLM